MYNTNTNLVTILKVCQDPVVGACFRLHPRHHHSALLCAHHELAEQGGDNGDIGIAVLNDGYLKVETLGWLAQRKGS